MNQKEGYLNLQRDKSILLIDVREPSEYAQGHLEAAKLVPLGELVDQIESVCPDKNRTLYLYCRSGARSGRACQMLSQMGYTDCYNLGGILEWPYEIVK